AETDLEAEIAEASDLISESEIALLPARAAEHAEGIVRLNSQIEFHVKLRDRLKADVNQAAHSCKQAMDDLDRAKRPVFQQISGEIAREIEVLEATSSALRDRLRGMSKSAPGALDDLALKAAQMVRGWPPPPPGDPQINSPRYRNVLAW